MQIDYFSPRKSLLMSNFLNLDFFPVFMTRNTVIKTGLEKKPRSKTNLTSVIRASGYFINTDT